MLSGKLIRLVERHDQEILNRMLRTIRQDPELTHLAARPEAEVRERGREILNNLGHWLEFGHEEKIGREYENIGKSRFHESVPLQESIRGLCLMKDAMIDFVRDQGVDRDCLALYAEEELERRVGRFFDLLVIHMARGYEMEWRHHAQAAAR